MKILIVETPSDGSDGISALTASVRLVMATCRP
jgi:hypothetical protein